MIGFAIQRTIGPLFDVKDMATGARRQKPAGNHR